MAITLISFKVITSLMVVWFFPSWYAVLIVIAVNSLWFMPLLYLLPRHFRIRYRYWQVRMRRRRLLHEEWHVD